MSGDVLPFQNIQASARWPGASGRSCSRPDIPMEDMTEEEKAQVQAAQA